MKKSNYKPVNKYTLYSVIIPNHIIALNILNSYPFASGAFYSVFNFQVVDARSGRSILDPFDYTSYGYINTFTINTDSVLFESSIIITLNQYPAEGTANIVQNGKVVCTTPIIKGKIRTSPFSLCGQDTFRLVYENDTLIRFMLVDSAHWPLLIEKSLLITVSDPVITKYSDKNGYDTRFFITGTDTMQIIYPLSDFMDWDLFLVNDSTGDTCYWKNRSPDWGIKGKISDDPFFQGDNYPARGFNQTTGFGPYYTDFITCDNLADGTYSILVQYFDGLGSVIPQLNIQLGTTDYGSHILHFWQSSPEDTLKKGDVWFAGKIKMPEMKYEPAGISK